MPRHDSYLLITGATGLLGRSLVRDLAAAGRRLAVIVRGSKTADAPERVDELLDDWREVAGVDVPCPVVLEGDLSAEGLGLAAEQRAWIAANVDEVVHSAASLSFQLRESDGEPYTSNVTGTRNMLALCRDTGVRRLHHVSSAYVCGLRQGRILETELDVGQTPGNDYERSKIVSEGEASAADFLDVCTVHRPSIIVGDLVNGFTNTFHGFYKPLRVVQPFVEAFVGAELEPGSLLEVLGMTGSECKNLVPVDWVSAAMTRIIGDESLHGRTYHLTSDRPTSVGTLCRVFEGLVVEMAAELKRQREARAAAGTARPKPAAAFDPLTLGKLFLDQMHVYKAYWRDDPRFDATHTHRAVPGLPAPALDEETIRRLCRFAIANNFRWPPPGRGPRAATARTTLEQLLGPAGWTAARATTVIGLAATGAGGGQWTIAVDGGRPVSLHVGLPASTAPVVWMAADALERLLACVATAAELRGRGELAVESGDPAGRRLAVDTIGRIAARPAAFANA
ncbi:MAG: SDR family oxidoreductase [Planctomycetia bacterium]